MVDVTLALMAGNPSASSTGERDEGPASGHTVHDPRSEPGDSEERLAPGTGDG